jgi:signal transduction histidine kinase
MLSELLQNVVRLMQHEARNRKVEIAFRNLWPGEVALLLDATKLEQLVINLVKNALEAIGEGGRIDLTLDHDGEVDRAIVVVEDDGPGLGEELKNGMFDPFRSTKRTGSGLGLAIVNRIVALHSGRITVDSELNRGTRFTLHLPRLKPETAARLSGGAILGAA